MDGQTGGRHWSAKNRQADDQHHCGRVRLTKRDGGRTAVDNVSFTASKDEIVGLLGPNGDAKTSTIPLLITVLAPTRGQFSVVGHPATTTIAIRRCVRVLSESSGYPESRARGRRSTADGGGERRAGALLFFGVLVGVLSWLPGPAVAAPLILEVFRISTVLGSNS